MAGKYSYVESSFTAQNRNSAQIPNNYATLLQLPRRNPRNSSHLVKENTTWQDEIPASTAKSQAKADALVPYIISSDEWLYWKKFRQQLMHLELMRATRYWAYRTMASKWIYLWKVLWNQFALRRRIVNAHYKRDLKTAVGEGNVFKPLNNQFKLKIPSRF